ncbi:hypothetical protein ACUIG5_00025 [Raoultella ornithinolytica]|jgi:hypothetical protein|uniref:hypothetical protein n=1 Tax=Raoultella ornithinolytica TaxID=54291 RepID=UPI002047A8FF|nr:MAG TPA: hypothetical protein [Caudoviricetes sp.]
MGFFTTAVNKWATKSQLKEITGFVNNLKVMDASELGMVMAVATHIRHGLQARGDDVLDPVICFSLNPGITYSLSSTVVDLQKSNQYSDAAGFMVWVHTLRSANSLELRQQGRDMWNELSRGFDHVPDAAHQILILTGKAVMYDGYYEYPKGLTPTPL